MMRASATRFPGTTLAAHVLAALLAATSVYGQEQEEETYREGQVPGLNRAASKIFFSEEGWSASLIGEFNGAFPVGGERDKSSGDIELYYAGLGRLTGYLGARLAPNIAVTAEVQIEYLVDDEGNEKTNFNPELYFDFLGNEHVNSRFGLAPLHIGYINNNDEPVLFYSVNRPETERLIIPTEWIEMGLHFYGQITKDWNYAFAFTNGPDAGEFKGPTWIRGGKEGRWDLQHINLNPKIEFTGLPHTVVSLSGYFGKTGQNKKIHGMNGEQLTVNAPISLLSGFVRWHRRPLTVLAMGAYGHLGETDRIFELTKEEQGKGQVVGEDTYGFYVEAGYDLLHLFPGLRAKKSNWLINAEEMELPVFFRFERLDTHASVLEEFQGTDFARSNLATFLVGLNFKASEKLVLKASYQLRENLSAPPDSPADADLFEIGLGFSF
jgi:hypothetical protein